MSAKLFVLPFTVSPEAILVHDWRERAFIAFDAEVRSLGMIPRKSWMFEPEQPRRNYRGVRFEVIGIVDTNA